MFAVRFFPHTLKFSFAAGTSRGVMHEKTSWFIVVEAENRKGIGEAGPLPGLSPDDRPDFVQQLKRISMDLQENPFPAGEQEIAQMARKLAGDAFPSIRFALETALLDWFKGGRLMLYDNSFYHGEQAIPINGLIWMGDKHTMRERMKEKLQQGYTCLKMKIGAIGFEEECAILAEVRKNFGPEDISLRVDANGAFYPADALQKLEKLAHFSLHSIEQPIKAGQPEEMHKLCRQSPVPIALDEELIGIAVEEKGKNLLQAIQPQYIILKPSLLGGLAASRAWIGLAEQQGIDWWITSALESNIGLNAISQFTAEFGVDIPQGLGTGQLYHNNIPSPLRIEQGSLWYEQKENWRLDIFNK